MDSHITVLYICGILFLIGLNNHVLSFSLMCLITLITFIGSFRMIDPVSKLLFHTITVGDHEIVDFEMSDQPSFEDSIVCNREYYSYEALLNNVLAYVINHKAPSDEIMFSLGNQQLTWGLSCGRYSYSYKDGKHYFEEFFDTTTQGLANGYDYNYWNSPNMTPFSIHYIFPEETIEMATSNSESDCYFYIYLPTINDRKELEIYDKYDILKEKSFIFRGWQMNCIKFKKNPHR